MDKTTMRLRRPALNFKDMRVPCGASLTWRDDPTIFVTVADERKVIYEGRITSLTAVTQSVLGTSRPARPSRYWVYKGKTIEERYNELYSPLERGIVFGD